MLPVTSVLDESSVKLLWLKVFQMFPGKQSLYSFIIQYKVRPVLKNIYRPSGATSTPFSGTKIQQFLNAETVRVLF